MSRSKTSKPEDLRNNFTQPTIANGSISTFDGKTSFNPGISCQKSTDYLRLMIQPGGTGDISMVQVSQDTNFDGSFDVVNAMPVPVSGVCGNGVVSCSPGSWNGCHYYAWGVSAAGAVDLQEVLMQELKGCYCVNNSCGSNLVMANLNSVLTDLGGGVVGAVTAADPRMGIVKATIDGNSISYSGSQATACTANPAVPQTSYAKNAANIGSDAFSAAATNSVYQALANSPAGAGAAATDSKCAIRRNINVEGAIFDEVVSVTGHIKTMTILSPSKRRYVFGGDGGCPSVDFKSFINVMKPDRLKSAVITYVDSEDWTQVRIDGNYVYSAGPVPWTGTGGPPGNCEQASKWKLYPKLSILPFISTQGSHAFTTRVSGLKDQRWGWVTLEIEVNTACEMSEKVVDGCTSLDANASCDLWQEDVDGVFTFRNGVKTGLWPLKQTQSFGTGACVVRFSRDWFVRDRTYRCSVQGGMPTIDHSRAEFIMSNSSDTVFKDRIQNADGSVTQTSRNFSMPNRPTVDSCEKICKTSRPKVNTDAALSGVVGSQQNNPIGVDTTYRQCEADNVCPAEPGETVVSACGCIDSFPEALVMMQAVHLSAADMACTTVKP